MPHIALPEQLPGISSAFAFRPETAKPMRELAHVLLHEANSLSPGERELIATYVFPQRLLLLPDQSWRGGRMSFRQQRNGQTGSC